MYQQTYDPYRGVGVAGQMFSQIGNKVASGLSGMLQNNEQWRKVKASAKSEAELKSQTFLGAVKMLEDSGLNPKDFKIPDPSREDVTSEQYLEALDKAISPAFKSMESNAPGEQDATRIGLNNMPMTSGAIKEQKAYQTGEAIGNVFDQKYPVEAPPQKQTILGEEFLTPVPMPEVDPEKEVEKEGIENIRMIRQLMKDGKIDPGMGSQMIIDGMSGINKNRGAKIALQKEQERQSKADADKQWGQTVGSSLNTNEIVVPGGGPVTKENLSSVGIGGVVDKGTTGSGKGTGTGRESSDKGTASWRQYKDIEAGLAKLRSGKDEDGSPLIYDTDPDKNKIRIAEEYQAKMNQSAQQLLSHWLETSGEDYDAAQNMSLAALTSDVVVDMTNRNEPYILGSNKTTGGQTIMQLNLAHPQTMKSLVDAAKAGYTASDVLASLKKLRGLNPSKIN